MIPNPNIYLQDEGQISHDLLPVKKRMATHLAWLESLLSSNQWLADLLFIQYADGATYANWVASTPYAYLDRVTYVDGAVYELQKTSGLTSSTPPNVDANWIKVLDSFVGVRERARYNGQKLMMEYLLNRRFQVGAFSLTEWEVIWTGGAPVTQSAPPYTQIYIKGTNNSTTNFWLSDGDGLTSYMNAQGPGSLNYLGNSYAAYTTIQFTIYVPSALYATIGANQPPTVTADQAIRAVVDQYVYAGAIYQITQY